MKKSQLYILAGIGVILIVGAGILVWKNMDREPRESTKDQAIQQVSEQSQTAVQNGAETDVVTEETYPQHIVAISGSDQVWYGIPELGVRMKLNKEFAEDLIYSHEEHNGNENDPGFDSADFSLKSLIAKYPQCTPPVLGTVSALKDSSDSKLTRMNNAKQVSMLSPGAQDVCWRQQDTAEAKKLLNKERDGSGAQSLQAGFETLQGF